MLNIIEKNENSVPETSTWENFKDYAESGTVPAVEKNGNLVNSFYKSVDYVGGGVSPLGKCITMVIASTVLLSCIVSSSILSTAFAYLSYLPAKGLAKVMEDKDLKSNTESLANYSSILQEKANDYSVEITNCVQRGLSYAFTAFIWILALPITPIVWLVDKCTSSKVSEIEEPEQVKANANEVSA